MPESIQHRDLVIRMETWVHENFSRYHWLSVSIDNAAFPGADDVPPRINGCLPDLYAADVPETFCIIGEAKTTKDLMSDRSQRQISIFLDYLTIKPGNNIFILAVPGGSTNQAIGVMRNSRYRLRDRNLKIFVLNEIEHIAIDLH